MTRLDRAQIKALQMLIKDHTDTLMETNDETTAELMVRRLRRDVAHLLNLIEDQ